MINIHAIHNRHVDFFNERIPPRYIHRAASRRFCYQKTLRGRASDWVTCRW
jgi:hypothetical protein